MKLNYGDPIDFEMTPGTLVKGTVVGLAAGNYLALYNGMIWAVPRAEAGDQAQPDEYPANRTSQDPDPWTGLYLPDDPPAWACRQDPERCESCGTLLVEEEDGEIYCPSCDQEYGACKTCSLPPERCGVCGLVPYNEEDPEADIILIDQDGTAWRTDNYDEFEQADWGDGSLSPEAEERKAALNRGRP